MSLRVPDGACGTVSARSSQYWGRRGARSDARDVRARAAKAEIARRIESGALRADAIEAVTCGYLAFVVVIGLAAQALLHAWSVDGVTSLAIVLLLIKEAREAWQGNECC